MKKNELLKPANREESDSLAKLDATRLPRHIAVIMDGNGRWASKRHLPRIAGHRAGMKATRGIVEACANLHIPCLTLYAFSLENWRRPRTEIEFLMRLLREYLKLEMPSIHKNNIRFSVIGRIHELPESVRNDLAEAVELTASNTGMQLAVALNYGARAELVDAFNLLIKEAGESSKLQVSEQAISDHLYTSGLPDPDLLIRTSGELRVSNFLLWQIAYAEIYVTDTLWPDFSRPRLFEALVEYQKRERRYGGLGASTGTRAAAHTTGLHEGAHSKSSQEASTSATAVGRTPGR